MKDFVSLIASELELQNIQVESTIKLLQEDNTVPFITRYRKEVTGGLQEDHIRAIQEKFQYYTVLEERRQTILESIESQGKLTDELREKILDATMIKTLEDLYLPYKPKKRTLATIAREKGLGPLGDEIWDQEMEEATFLKKVEEAVDPEKELPSQEEVLKGLQHILAEKVSEVVEVRESLRKIFKERGLIETQGTPEEKEKEDTSDYRDYFEFDQPVRDLPPHRTLAINRGEREGALRVYLRVPEEEVLEGITKDLVHTSSGEIEDLLCNAIEDGYQRLLYPSICREIRSDLTQVAEEHAIDVFSKNLRKVLLSPPVRGKRILGIDPGFRTGCKLASLDEFGNLLDVGVFYLHAPEKGQQIVAEQMVKHKIQLIAIGNGTAHRETEEFVSELISEAKFEVEYIIVNEAGASVYSASKEAQDEFPDLEASFRGTISIARRLQDPLAEIVKIDPKAMGVGLYQHDVNPKALQKAVDDVVESCVNYVGVDLNTASVSLLKYVSGLNRLQARRIFEHRQKQGAFRSRDELMKVRGVGADTFVQAAGFLRIPDGDNPFDNTQIHPESYDKTRQLLEKISITPDQLREASRRPDLHKSLDTLALKKIADDLEIGLPTLRDIVENLKKPGRDPRDELPKPFFRKGVLKLEDLKVGMELKGTIRNVVDFGAFVDLGVKEDGLVHVSQMADKFVKNPLEVVSVGDIVDVRIIGIDANRRRISLTMKSKTAGGDDLPPRPREGGRKNKESRGQKSPSPPAQKSPPSGMGNLGMLFQKEFGKDKKK